MASLQDSNLTDSSDRSIVVGAGTAGTPTGGVVTVQGVSGGTNLNVSQVTASDLNATVRNQDGAGNNLTSQSYDSIRPLDVRIVQFASSTATHTRTTFVTGNVSQIIAAANPARKWLMIVNQSGARFFIKFGSTAVVNQGIYVEDNSTYSMPTNMLYLGAIHAIVGSNNRTIEIIEGT